jgi:transposase-like protein
VRGQLARTRKELSREARARLDWMDYYCRCLNVALTCRHFGISRQIFYRWQKRYDSRNLTTLEGRSPRPHRRRSGSASPSLMPMISAACHQVICLAAARKITSCTFIARSVAALVLIRPDISCANDRTSTSPCHSRRVAIPSTPSKSAIRISVLPLRSTLSGTAQQSSKLRHPTCATCTSSLPALLTGHVS